MDIEPNRPRGLVADGSATKRTAVITVITMVLTLSLMGFPMSFAVAESSTSGAMIEFDIPAQALDQAFVAYGDATGLQVFYDGSLATGRRSEAVEGAYTPMAALQALLKGTGYLAKQTDDETVTIVRPPKAAAPHASAVLAGRYESYLALLQARVSQALCASDDPKPGGEQIMFSFWIDPSGTISQAVLRSSAGDAERHAISENLQGLHIGRAPPADFLQPVTMVVFPPAAGEAAGCPARGRRSVSR